ncbi:FecR family protein [Spongiimicrobium sp. 3-5]|uniref:FecR family protein n=1 Tax=Spongiimicrobium sp. 3-5 TaxID=3332596 RepID=UPI00397F36C4
MKDNSKPFLDKLLNDSSFRNWANNGNRNDVAFWNAWIKNNPDKIAVVNNAKDILLGITFKKNDLGDDFVHQKLEDVLDKIQEKDQKRASASVLNLKSGISRLHKVAAIAAIGLVFIVVGVLVTSNSQQVLHKTGYGEVMNLKLPDGTSVVLNGNSEISYTKKNTRDVSLKGEAYFKVKPKYASKAKFWVNTKDLRVEVYGTQFHVNTRDEKTDVALDEGSINLLLNNGVYKEMVPGEFVSYSDETKVIFHEKVSQEQSYSLWREGTYIFNNIKLKEVMKHLEYAYGIPAEFTDQTIADRVLSGGIPNENLQICLFAIEKSTGTKIVRKDNKLIILNNQ